MKRYVLAFETSCDETSCAVFDIKMEKILSCIIKSQIDIHKKIGGVIPDRAAQEHLIYIDLVLEEALAEANLTIDDIDYIACTNGPGLPGALLIGFNFAKSLAWKYHIPFIPVNHIEGHIYSAGIEQRLQFPFLCLSVSGGHTAMYRVDNFSSYTLLSNTQDDAAGELFDKVSNLIGLGYPGGAILEQYAKEISFKDSLNYPRLKKDTGYLSFSGLKTAVLYDLIKRGLYNLQEKKLFRELLLSEKQDIASSLLNAVADSLVSRLEFFLKNNQDIQEISFVGGVSCNMFITDRIKELCVEKGLSFKSPFKKIYSTDNAAMIAYIAQYRKEQSLSVDIIL